MANRVIPPHRRDPDDSHDSQYYRRGVDDIRNVITSTTEPLSAEPGTLWYNPEGVPEYGVDIGISKDDADSLYASKGVEAKVPQNTGVTGQVAIQGPTSPKFADMDTAILTHYVELSADPAANRVAVQQLLERIKPSGDRKQVRLFIPPRFDASGNPDPILVSRTGSAWALDAPSGVTIEGAGRGSTLKLADDQVNFSRLITVNGKSHVTIRNLRLDGNLAAQNAANVQSHNINIADSTDVIVEDVESVGAAGDGLDIGGVSTPSDRILVRHLVSNNVGRNPISVCDANNVWIVDPDLDCTSGGQAIDSEPNMAASYTGLHILGGRIKNSGSGTFALALDGTAEPHRRRNIVVQGVEFDGGGISMPHTEDVVIANCIGTIDKIDAKYHTRRVKLLNNDWLSTATGIAVEVSGVSGGEAYPAGWTVIGTTLIAPNATTGWQFWDIDDLIFSGNSTEGSAAMGAAMKLRANFRSIANLAFGPNIWKTATNGIFAERTGTMTVDGLAIGPQVFRGITSRIIDLQTVDYISNLTIGAQTRNSGSIRLGAGTRYVMAGVPGFGATWSCSGDPNGQIAEAVGAVAYRRDGGAGTTMYVKESGTGNTGWVAK